MPERFPYAYVVQFWRSHAPDTVISSDPDERAPGLMPTKPATFVHGAIPAGQKALLERKLTLASDALLALPPLKDVHGCHLTASINIFRKSDDRNRIAATLSIAAFPLDLKSPKTFQLKGRYYTPGEGPSLTVAFNDWLGDYSDGPVKAEGSYNGLQVQWLKGAYNAFVLKSSRPLAATKVDAAGFSKEIRHPDFFDLSLAPSQLQLMTMRLRWLNPQFANGRELPTSCAARLAAALYMADWGDILEQMETVR